MPPLIHAQSVGKAFGATALFRALSFPVSAGDRIGVIGPNGSGKSTLLRILAGEVEPDSGEVTRRKGMRVAHVAQASEFPGASSVLEVVRERLEREGVAADEWEVRAAAELSRAGFQDFTQPANTLSGGWKKRLALAAALATGPDLLLLDEPTNHLDLAGIDWLEALLIEGRFAGVAVSHDRYFLDRVAGQVVEINRLYPDGALRVEGNYSAFLEKKEAWLEARQQRQSALENRVRTEIEWLRRGPKARATKAKARMDTAQATIGELAAMRDRGRSRSVDIELIASGRQTKRLAEFQDVGYGVEDRPLFHGLSFALNAGMRIGMVGDNGSGKTTLLRLLRGELTPQSGTAWSAPGLRVAYLPQIADVLGRASHAGKRRSPAERPKGATYQQEEASLFDQNRGLDESVTLRQALAPDGDSVIFQGRLVHVASWANRFLFTGEQLGQPVARLSGGERARVLIARLMLEPADLLLLDEPTNDLDIPTLEILEENLLEYPGAMVLVTHDRYLLDRVATAVWGLNGDGGIETFAALEQWEAWRMAQQKSAPAPPRVAHAVAPARSPAKKRLGYLEDREYSTLEARILEAEAARERARAVIEDPAIASDGPRLLAAMAELETASARVDALYQRWAELEAKLGTG